MVMIIALRTGFDFVLVLCALCDFVAPLLFSLLRSLVLSIITIQQPVVFV